MNIIRRKSTCFRKNSGFHKVLYSQFFRHRAFTG